MKLVLASASPRRKDLLELIGLTFEIKAGNIEENLDPQLELTKRVEKVAFEKAEVIAKSLSENHLVLGADTIVEVDGEILGKPKDKNDAKRMLKQLSGRSHNVITGIALIPTDKKIEPVTAHEKTEVKFKNLTEEEIDNYINTGECFDKAGAYAIQGIGTVIVDGVYGCYTNVVGLPIPLLMQKLNNFGIKVI